MKTFFIDDSEDHITPAAIDASSTKLIPAHSVLLVTRSGILKHSLPVAVARVPVTLNQDMRAVSPEGVLPGYLANYLRSSAQAILHTCAKDGTTVNSVDTDRLLAWPVPVAPIEVQHSILKRLGELFSEIDDGDAALAEAQAGVETYRKVLLRAAVTGELTANWRRENRSAETGKSSSNVCSQTAVSAGPRVLPTALDGTRSRHLRNTPGCQRYPRDGVGRLLDSSAMWGPELRQAVKRQATGPMAARHG